MTMTWHSLHSPSFHEKYKQIVGGAFEKSNINKLWRHPVSKKNAFKAKVIAYLYNYYTIITACAQITHDYHITTVIYGHLCYFTQAYVNSHCGDYGKRQKTRCQTGNGTQPTFLLSSCALMAMIGQLPITFSIIMTMMFGTLA